MHDPLGTFQDRFGAALLDDAGDAAPAGLDAEGRRRFRVYRNNVRHGLAEAVGAAYPVVRRLVGEAFFTAMARAFVQAHPPTSRSLALYGAALPAFIDDFPPAATLPYLGDVARLERAALEALHAADAQPLAPTAIADLGEAIDDARFAPHPAARLVPSPHPIVSLWQANQGEAQPTRIQGHPETALVTRPDDRVVIQRLTPAEGAFARTILEGERPTRAFAAACALEPAFDLVNAWRLLLVGGALATVAPADIMMETTR